MTILLTITLAVAECARTDGGQPFIDTYQNLEFVVISAAASSSGADPQGIPEAPWRPIAEYRFSDAFGVSFDADVQDYYVQRPSPGLVCAANRRTRAMLCEDRGSGRRFGNCQLETRPRR
ncbi:MAG: hypothetical protein H6739_37085 [Alphaproteobacteria bacterium]|nr:hypothetical protein [Alphaproteobacteria bacterium]